MDLYRDLLDSLGAIVWEDDPDARRFVGLDRIHPDDRPRVLAACIQAIERCTEDRIEYRVTGPDGRTRWIRNAFRVVCENGRALRLVGAMMDVTEWHEQRDREGHYRAMLERERIYQATFDEALIGLAQTSLDGRFLLVNHRLCDLLGYTVDELRALDFMTISHPDEVARDIEAGNRLIAGATDRYTREKRYRRKDGSFVWTNLTVSLHRHVGGEPNYFIAIIEDITERKRAEEEARQVHKMEAIGRLAGGIAHDFHNLLIVIVGYADLVLNQLNTDDPVCRDIQEIRAAGKRAASLTRQLLAFSRKQILQPQVLDLNVIVSRMDGLLRRLIGENVRLECRPEQSLDRVRADPGEIEQVILNLALNARDAMPQGGTLAIETANVELDRAYTSDHPGATAGRHVMLAISDTGTGMDDTVQEHLFEPYYTTKGPGKGTGLGLATVYGIVKQSGGSIFVQSEPEHGTTFKVFLPRVEPVVEAAGVQPDTSRALGGSETILLVEDHPEVRAVARAMLTRHGYTVLEASQGKEALQIEEDHHEEIHLLLTDVVMPAMSGHELARRLLQRRPDVRLLYTSGYTHDAIVPNDVIESGVAFIEKPFTPADLLRKVREVLDGRE